MTEKNAAQAKLRKEVLALDRETQNQKRQLVMGNLVEKLTPWLFEFGNWIFGGLIAINLIVIGSLLTVGPVDTAVMVAIAAFACALPLNLAGLFVLRLTKDLNDVAIDDVMREAFQSAEIATVEAALPVEETKKAVYKQRADVGLRYSVRLGAVSSAVTLIGIVGALWHMGWWVAVIFIGMVIASAISAMSEVAHLMRPTSDNPRGEKPPQRQ